MVAVGTRQGTWFPRLLSYSRKKSGGSNVAALFISTLFSQFLLPISCKKLHIKNLYQQPNYVHLDEDMSKIDHTPKTNPDDRLAEFTDQVLSGKIQTIASGVDGELALLEATILLLINTYPPVPMDEARVKQMQVRLRRRIRREAEAKPSFWENILPRFPVTAAISVLSLLFIALLISPFFAATGSSITAAAGSFKTPSFVALGAAACILLILWIRRAK
jgi:polyferredoxin